MLTLNILLENLCDYRLNVMTKIEIIQFLLSENILSKRKRDLNLHVSTYIKISQHTSRSQNTYKDSTI